MQKLFNFSQNFHFILSKNKQFLVKKALKFIFEKYNHIFGKCQSSMKFLEFIIASELN